MDGKMLARLAAIVLIAFALTARAIHLTLEGGPGPARPSASIGVDTPRADPLRETMVRCQGLGEAATRDSDCLAAWAENRRRFLGQDKER